MSIEAMKQWLEALETKSTEYSEDGCDLALGKRIKAAKFLRQAIAEAEKQEPKEPLTYEQIEKLFPKFGGDMLRCVRAIEAAHKIGKGEA